MAILIACEESQVLSSEFRNFGFEAFSCDIIPCSGLHPEFHIMQDVLPLLNGHCSFRTLDGLSHFLPGSWDLIIAHPPCTYLCSSGQKHCNISVYGQKAIDRIVKRDDAFDFFMRFTQTNCPHVCIENPIGYMSSHYRKPDQYIQPYFFGDPVKKTTGLWLFDLPLLRPDNIVEVEYIFSGTGRKWPKWFWDSSCISDPFERSRFRSRTFPGIARAMVEQWGAIL